MYRYILRESCSQFDSLPLTSLPIFLTGRSFDQLGDEIYMQLMKQITPDASKTPSPGPSEEASDRGWLVLAMCCATYPPSAGFQPFLERFLRSHGKDVHLHLMHMTILGGSLAETPEPEALYKLLRGGAIDDILATLPRTNAEVTFSTWENVVEEPAPQAWRCAARRAAGAAPMRTPTHHRKTTKKNSSHTLSKTKKKLKLKNLS